MENKYLIYGFDIQTNRDLNSEIKAFVSEKNLFFYFNLLTLNLCSSASNIKNRNFFFPCSEFHVGEFAVLQMEELADFISYVNVWGIFIDKSGQ